jgi:predicted Zn-dependent protease
LLSLVKLDVAQGHADRAKIRLEAMLDMRPDHVFAHGLLGEVLALSGHPQEADIQFREASRVNPKWIEPWLAWGELWLAQKQPDQAIQVIQAGLKANPDSEELHMILASAYSNGGQIDPAITAYGSALRLNPRGK